MSGGRVKRLYLHPPLERIWHGVHTLGILVLCLTGAHIHWPGAFPLFGRLETAMVIHNVFGILVTVDFALWFPYVLLAGRIKHYIPRRRDLIAGTLKQAKFYGFDIFRGGGHPFEVTEDQKFNPMQKWAYIGVMFGLVPSLIATGIGLLLPSVSAEMLAPLGGIRVLAIAHTLLAFSAAAFVASHLYMATMGYTPLDAFKSMVTGWALEADHGHGSNDTGTGDETADPEQTN